MALSTQLEKFDEKFPCIQCTGDGHAPIQISDTECEDAQCEYHGRVIDPIKSFLTETYHLAFKEGADTIKDFENNVLEAARRQAKEEAYDEVMKIIEGMNKKVLDDSDQSMWGEDYKTIHSRSVTSYNKALSDLRTLISGLKTKK